MEPINFSQLPNIPPSQITEATELALNTTDSNGVAYVGKTTLGQLLNDGGSGCACVHTVALTLSSAEILALNTTPVQFGITVPAGFYVRCLAAEMRMIYNSAAYATNTQVGIRNVGATGPQLLFGAGALATAGNLFNPIGQSVSASNEIVIGADVEAYVSGGDPTAGDSDITLYLTYILIEA